MARSSPAPAAAFLCCQSKLGSISEGDNTNKWGKKVSILLAAVERLLLIYLLSGFSDWLLSPVVVVSIRGDFFTSILLLVSCKQQEMQTERLEAVL